MRRVSVGKLLFGMSFPAILSMLVQSLYNIVDSLFVAQMTSSVLSPNYAGTNIGADSFTAISVVFPMTMLIISIGIGIGVGANAYIARKLGEGNRNSANQAAKSAIVMGFCIWLVILILAFTVSEPFVRAFVTAENATDVDYVIEQAKLYLTIYMAGSLGSIIEITASRILQSTGNMKVPMFSQLIGAITNIILDAVFILGLKLGVLGAVLATVIGQWLAAIFVICVFVFKKQDVSLSLKGYKPKKEYFTRILKIGLPTFVMNAIGAFITIIMNLILKSYANGIFVLSAYFKVQSFIFMPVFGLMQGTMPILSYNYGANEKKRFNETFKLSLLVALIIMVLGLILFQSIPEYIMRIFNSSPSQTEDGAYAFRIISISFVPAAFSILIINMLQSVNKPLSSLLMSLSRQLLFLIPAAFLLNYLWGLKGIWFCYPFAETVSVLLFLYVAVRDYKKQFARKQKQYDEGTIDKDVPEITVPDSASETVLEPVPQTTISEPVPETLSVREVDNTVVIGTDGDNYITDAKKIDAE